MKTFPIVVHKDHLQRGINKYNGRVDTHIQQLLVHAHIRATPYIFADGRVLLVYDQQSYGILYPTTASFYKRLSL